MPFTHAAIEMFISERISKITVCNVTDVVAEFPGARNWVSGFGLVVIFNDQPAVAERPFLLRFLRRAELAFEEYRLARESLQELVACGARQWSPYYRALSRFESVIAQLYQGIDSVVKRHGKKLFEKHDGTVEQRLNEIYNCSKHGVAGSDQPVWFTNDGLESDSAKLSFSEIESLLRQFAEVAARVSSSPAEPVP